jgi:uncharacterized protein YjbI with pentapeptide repeats
MQIKNIIILYILLIIFLQPCYAYDIDHLERLEKENSCINCNLIRVDLFGKNPAVFENSILINSILNGNFSYSSFENSNMKNSILLADCRFCKFDKDNLSGVINDSSFNDFTGSSFKNANLTGINLSWANLSETDFSGADLSQANLRNTLLYHSKITKEQLNQAKNICGAILPEGNYYVC